MGGGACLASRVSRNGGASLRSLGTGVRTSRGSLAASGPSLADNGGGGSLAESGGASLAESGVERTSRTSRAGGGARSRISLVSRKSLPSLACNGAGGGGSPRTSNLATKEFSTGLSAGRKYSAPPDPYSSARARFGGGPAPLEGLKLLGRTRPSRYGEGGRYDLCPGGGFASGACAACNDDAATALTPTGCGTGCGWGWGGGERRASHPPLR
ncbi:hypothetical protein DFH07DRAFT_863805 [Mycena maculata]|uniref:Uncharacterized protein n=1 Tax=Mycena maculata TaxID=230809 RepID=A0AAD7MF47_9AGAR|nr:hypothetical protein DFH07DRAFT_863805 [Mycena maculata]